MSSFHEEKSVPPPADKKDVLDVYGDVEGRPPFLVALKPWSREFASVESRLVSDGHRICEFHRRLKSGGNVEQHVTTCSKLYMKSIGECVDQHGESRFGDETKSALTFWHLSHICMLSRDKSVVPELCSG